MSQGDGERTGRATEALRGLPSIAAVTADPAVAEVASGLRPEIVTAVAQQVVERFRRAILAGEAGVDPDQVVPAVREELTRLLRPRLATVINGTGVIIHTNLGRAPVSAETARAMEEAATTYTPLELQLESGRRGGRMEEVSRLMRALTGAEATLVVNNNAAAVLLTLSALCAGREVILSRGQAVEIGGGFRVPDVMVQGGARLVEVGTTNRTYARDYEAAITEQTAALLAVHWSNFRIIGFTAQPSLAALAEIARRRGLVLIEDLGSGCLIDTAPFGLAHEPTVGESLAAGVDVVCFSGDKLLGGPQAGIISGRADLVQRIAAHPLARAVRADKTALAGVAATLRHYLRGDVTETVPIWRMIAAPVAALEARCRAWAAALAAAGDLPVVASRATIGGGSLPEETLESRALAVDAALAARHGLTLPELAARLRAGEPPLMPYVADDRLLIDARTVLPEQDDGVVRALAAALGVA
ncbi:MAG: L-seryl-tRNA(Sec) selenium transferase [Sphaerobacter sp.]|nr:L-seryl-tRNA(Sec) selenium transferase [Sphaerobacter sp.]